MDTPGGYCLPEEMVAGTERGLYITRFWYTRTVHPREAVGREARHVWSDLGIRSAPALKLTVFNLTARPSSKLC